MVNTTAIRIGALVLLAFTLACGGINASPPRASMRAASMEPARVSGSDTLFAHDFDDGKPTGLDWDRHAVWSVVDGSLRANMPSQKQLRSFAFLGSPDWTNYAVEVDMRGIRGVDKGVAVRVTGSKGVGVDLRGDGYHDVVMYRGLSKLDGAPVINRNGTWQRVRIEVRGGRYRVFVNRVLKLDYADPKNERPRGRVALAAYTGGSGQCELLFDNLVVTRLEANDPGLAKWVE